MQAFLDQYFFNLAIAIIIFTLFLLLRKVFTKYIFKFIIKLSTKTKTDLDTRLLLSFQSPLQVFFILLGLYVSTRYLLLSFLPVNVYYSNILTQLFRTAMIILIAWGFFNFSSNLPRFFPVLEKRLDVDLDKLVIPFLSKILKGLIVFIAGVLVADEWGFDINGFIAGLGLGGLAFALAAQDTISNFFGGMVIILDKPFSIGDWIETPNVEGTVEDINFRSTKVRTFSNAVVTVPNSTLANEAITNWSRMGKRRVTFSLGVTHQTPKEKLKRCIAEIKTALMEHPGVHPETIFVSFEKFSDSSLDIFVYFFTTTTKWGEFLKVREDVNFRIMGILESEGIAIAYPSRRLYMENGELNARIKDD